MTQIAALARVPEPNAVQPSPAPADAAPLGGARPGASRSVQAARDARLDPRLVGAAHQFEASMMAELLKPLTAGSVFGEDEQAGGQAGGGLSDLTSSAEGSGGALMSFSTEALARALSEKGGLGIARRVLDHFEAAQSPAQSPGQSPGQSPAPNPAQSPARTSGLTSAGTSAGTRAGSGKSGETAGPAENPVSVRRTVLK